MKKAKWIALLCVLVLTVSLFSGCGNTGNDRRIIRIGHNQATTHPTHIGLTAFADSKHQDAQKGNPFCFFHKYDTS